jgi:hypothetical protein
MSILSRMHPLTNSGHVFLVSIKKLSPAMKSFLTGLYTKNAEVREPAAVGVTLSAGLEFLTDGVDGQFPTRLLLVETRNSYTTVFNNAWRSKGWFEMAFPLTAENELSDVYFRSQASTIRKAEGKSRGQYGSVQFIRIASGEIVRIVSLVNDGGRWVFSTQGAEQPFERLAAYSAPRKTDRFTNALLEDYLAAMELFPYRDDFYRVDEQHPAIGIEIAAARGSGEQDYFPAISIETVREKYGPFE